MDLSAFSHVACVNIHQFFKDFRSFDVILLLESPDAGFKVPDGGLVGHIGLRPWRS